MLTTEWETEKLTVTFGMATIEVTVETCPSASVENRD